ncbi:Uncharacterised protein [Mycobacteroides abscessus subsp. abscessus]|uniref:hypothetical protein n=1 Tax=Mycobacteroides abscessus TaxID=36809 RepID=UPI0009CBB542|nr:hypothetical protein [Mycobacteroides abscessus]SLI70574.1 Uncharacterised protein [Mycobacteroides abscessus subsp. abscessus]
MANPKPGDAGYDDYREKYNARRRKRRQDPEYVKRANARARAQVTRRKAKAKEGNDNGDE